VLRGEWPEDEHGRETFNAVNGPMLLAQIRRKPTEEPFASARFVRAYMGEVDA
jgi:hypothetical protein